jgi:hypothetical protein
VVHDHIKKLGHWNPEESPHDVPHYTVAPRLSRDYYKRARSEAEEEEARVRRRMSEAVDDLEGFSAQGDPNQQMEDMIEDLYRPARRQGSGRQAREGPTSDLSTLLQIARTPIYDGASFSVLRAAMEMMNLQTSYGWSNASVDALLSLMGKMLPQPHRLPATREDARKQMITLHGLDYVRIQACIKDCVLFRGEFADLSKCPKCGEARYRRDVSSLQVPRKVSLKISSKIFQIRV